MPRETPGFIGREIDHAIGNEHVGKIIRHRERLDFSQPKFHIGIISFAGIVPGFFDHRCGHVYANHFIRGSDFLGSEEAIESST